MTYEEANEYQWLVKEIAMLQEELSELDSQYHAIAEKHPKIRSEYNEVWHTLDARIKACISRCEHFEWWLSEVKDIVTQNYMYLRFVNNLTWVQIGAQLNRKPNTVRRAVSRFFEKEAQRNAV